MAKIPKEIGKLKSNADAWQYVLDNSLKGVDGSLLYRGESGFGVGYGSSPILFAFGSAWTVDVSNYADTAPLPGQTLSSVYRLLRIDLITKRVVAIIPLPGRLRFRNDIPDGSADYRTNHAWYLSYIGLAMCEGAGKVWLAFGRGGKGPWNGGDRNDQHQTYFEGGDAGMGWYRGLVISVDPADNMVKTINPLDNGTESPSIVFGGGFIWVGQTPMFAEFSDDVLWSPLLRIDPSSTYSMGDPNLMARHPTLRVMLHGLSEEAYPTDATKLFAPWVEPWGQGGYRYRIRWRTGFAVEDMVFADGYLIMTTSFMRVYYHPYGWSFYVKYYRISRINVLSLEVKKGSDLFSFYTMSGDVVISSTGKVPSAPIFSPLNGGRIWSIYSGYTGNDEIWVGDLDLNFTKMPVPLSRSNMGSIQYFIDDPTPDLNVLYGLAFDGIDIFASALMGLAPYGGGPDYNGGGYSVIDTGVLRINPKSETIKSIILYDSPSDIENNYYGDFDRYLDDGQSWLRGTALYILYADNGVLWVTPSFTFGTGRLVFPIKQGRFGGWKVGKI